MGVIRGGINLSFTNNNNNNKSLSNTFSDVKLNVPMSLSFSLIALMVALIHCVSLQRKSLTLKCTYSVFQKVKL